LFSDIQLRRKFHGKKIFNYTILFPLSQTNIAALVVLFMQRWFVKGLIEKEK